jgi:hypothetical protein
MARPSKRWLDAALIMEANEAVYVAAAIFLVGVLLGWAIGSALPRSVPVNCLDGLEVIDAS